MHGAYGAAGYCKYALYRYAALQPDFSVGKVDSEGEFDREPGCASGLRVALVVVLCYRAQCRGAKVPV